jgi:hypothetical protein
MNMMAAADNALENAKVERPGYFFEYMNAVLMSAISIEAIANSFGAELFKDWDHFDAMRPMGKILLIADKLEIKIDREQEPWSAIPWLISLRNEFAHAKPKLIEFEKEMSKKEYEMIRKEMPTSKLERQMTLQVAERAVRTTENVLIAFANALPEERRFDFLSDSWSGSASPVINQEGQQDVTPNA